METKKMVIAQIERTGDRLVIPQKISFENAIQLIMRQARYESERVNVERIFDVSPWDGALSLARVLDKVFGALPPSYAEEEGFFGKQRVSPKAKEVPSGPNGQTASIPWGVYEIPMLGVVTDGAKDVVWTARVSTEFHVEGNPHQGFSRIKFKIEAELQRQYEEGFNQIMDLVEQDLAEHSLYRGKAFRLSLLDNDGDPKMFPEVNFMDVGTLTPDDLILAQVSHNAVHTSIFTPLQRTADLRRLGIPLRRGVLLAGPFGTGKTMTANVAAGLAAKHGWTFVYVEHARELASVLRFVKAYLPAVVFCEDVDRIVSGERTSEMDSLLNVIDGVDGKQDETMIVLTTNDVDSINPAFLRPGRMDDVIDMQLPDVVATRKLVHVYGRGLIDPDDSLTLSSKALAGQVPAMIREAVERAKLVALKNGKTDIRISDADLAEVADSMQLQRRLLAPKAQDNRSDVEKAAAVVAAGLSGYTIEEFEGKANGLHGAPLVER